MDSAISIGYATTGSTNQRYILFDKYNVIGNSGRPIRIYEGVDFLDEINMNNYRIHLNPSGTSHMYSTLIGGTDPAVRIGNSLWVDSDIYASSVKLNGADYSEFFEWVDGNLEDEDRVGYIVALSGDEIIKANR